MEIQIVKGVGSAKTKLAAFDRALHNAGIANYNLICLSSVIPKDSRLIVDQIKTNPNNYGKRLYVVMSKHHQTEKGKDAWAGLGWTQDKDGRGLFVEHHGASKKEVEKLIKNSLTDMIKYRPYKYENIKMLTTGMTCKDKPVCATVVAIYCSADWQKPI